MIDESKIFNGTHTDIMELLMALVDPQNSIEDKRKIWKVWRDWKYNPDELHEFFSDSLFADGGFQFLDIVCHNDYKNFYEMAMSLDLANFDPKAYYLYWILCYNEDMRPWDSAILKEALEYDPETIKGMFPDIEQVIMNEEV